MARSGRVTPAVLGQARPWSNVEIMSNLFDPPFFLTLKCTRWLTVFLCPTMPHRPLASNVPPRHHPHARQQISGAIIRHQIKPDQTNSFWNQAYVLWWLSPVVVFRSALTPRILIYQSSSTWLFQFDARLRIQEATLTLSTCVNGL